MNIECRSINPAGLPAAGRGDILIALGNPIYFEPRRGDICSFQRFKHKIADGEKIRESPVVLVLIDIYMYDY